MANKFLLLGNLYIMRPVGRYRALRPANNSLVSPDFRGCTIIFGCPLVGMEVYSIDFPSGRIWGSCRLPDLCLTTDSGAPPCRKSARCRRSPAHIQWCYLHSTTSPVA